MISLLLSYIALSLQFRLKHTDNGFYVCDGTIGSKKPLMPCIDEHYSITDWQIEKKSNGAGLISPVGNLNVLDVAEAWRVEVKVKHGKSNQMFSIVYVSPDKYILVNREKCLTFEDKTYHMRVCNYGTKQLYTIVHNDNEANELTRTKAAIDNSTSAVDNARFDKLQKMIEDNKELARHIASNHKQRITRHHHHHHYNNNDHSIGFSPRQGSIFKSPELYE